MPHLAPDMIRRLCRARELLRPRDGGEPSVAAIARAVMISRYHFLRRFEQVFGTTPVRYRARARIERAQELLTLTDWPVTEICLAVGFTSLGSFSALFRRSTGQTPSEYRRRTRALVEQPGVLPEALAPGCLSLMGRALAGQDRNSGEA